MGRQIVRQPNGKLAGFSSIVDNFVWYDATEDEARALLRKEYEAEIERRIDAKMRAIDEPDAWLDCVSIALLVHRDADHELVALLLDAGMSEAEIDAIRAKNAADLDREASA